MLISLNWLKEYIELDKDISTKELEYALTMIGQEVEKIEKQGENLKDVLTAKILKLEKHSNADSLTVCQLDNGKEVLQVVCGAPNHREGDIVAMAQVGAKLEEDFIIKKGKIRGEESNGMLCSEVELNIGTDGDGIIILPENTPLGVSMNEYLGLNDTIFELEITPNRPDCLSHIGIARELSAYYNKDLKIPVNSVEVKDSNKIDISIEDNVSNRYLARVIKGVKVGDSPKWLKERLEAVGIRSINNLVDISNYVMLETNQPNHIFDYNKFNSNKIVLKRANEGETFVTLDEKERVLNSEDIVVSNGQKVVALAGVMGGLDTEVDNNTTDILIEVAHFDNISVRKTSRRLALSSESSYRFERRVNEENMIYVMDRIASLVTELAGGVVCEINDSYPNKLEEKVTTLSIERMNKFIGKVIPKDKVLDIFRKLEISVVDNGNTLELTAPSHRQDLVNQFDYFEEVIRMVGFDNIENIMPNIQINKSRLVDTTAFTTKVKLIAANSGLREVINYSFIPANACEKLLMNTENLDLISVKNPIVEDFTVLRPTLMYSLLKNVRDNVNRGANNLRLFEVGKRFSLDVNGKDPKGVYLGDKLVSEKETLGIVLAGNKGVSLWDVKNGSYDFYDIKGIVEHIFAKLGFTKYQVRRSENPSYHQGRSVDIFVGRELIGSFGQIHPDVEENMDVEKVVVLYGEIYLDLIKKYIKEGYSYKGLSKYQSVSRDIAIVVNKNVLVGDMVKSVEKADNKIIESVQIFDVYQGVGIEEGHKSVAINIVMRDANRTLEEKDINAVVDKAVAKLAKEYGAKLR